MRINLDDEARDMLLNANAYRGGALGLGSSDALALLVWAGYATPRGFLTQAGAQRALEEQHDYFSLREED